MTIASVADPGVDRKAHVERSSMAAVIRRLASEFPELSPEQIENAVRGVYDDYEGSKVRDFVPVLVERTVRSDLSEQRRYRA